MIDISWTFKSVLSTSKPGLTRFRCLGDVEVPTGLGYKPPGQNLPLIKGILEWTKAELQEVDRCTVVTVYAQKELPSARECTQDPTWTDCMWKDIKEEGV